MLPRKAVVVVKTNDSSSTCNCTCSTRDAANFILGQKTLIKYEKMQ